jgi:peptide-methionine (S)-S-oxide reductase
VKSIYIVLAVLLVGLAFVMAPAFSDSHSGDLIEYAKKENTMTDNTKDSLQHAILAGGCFWCVEAVYERIEGVVSAVSGYSGGTVPNPTYTEVTTGNTGHAEAVKITFDPDVITYADILKIFWKTHDPTTLNRQGADVGTQYRSAIFYEDDNQRKIAEESLKEAQDSFSSTIVTEIAPLDEFYEAEDYHQDYFANNSYAGYCRVVIAPKLEKLFGEEY